MREIYSHNWINAISIHGIIDTCISIEVRRTITNGSMSEAENCTIMNMISFVRQVGRQALFLLKAWLTTSPSLMSFFWQELNLTVAPMVIYRWCLSVGAFSLKTCDDIGRLSAPVSLSIDL